MQHKDNILITKIINEIDFAVKRIENMSQKDFMNDVDAQHSVEMAVINVRKLL